MIDSIIRIENNNLIIAVISSNIVEALRPDVDVVREVASYNRNNKKGLKGVIFIITNGDYSSNRHIVSVKHTVSFDYHRYSSVINYTSGKK